MRKVKNKDIITFDIETTGLSAIDNEFFVAVAYDGKDEYIFRTLNQLAEWNQHFDWTENVIATYNGQNYRGGFDFPFLRTQLIEHKVEWPFESYAHIDLLPIVKKYFDTSRNEVKIDSVGSLYKADLVKICKVNGIEYQATKQDTYDMLLEMDTDWLEYKKELNKDHNDMQSVYQYYFDKDGVEQYIDGADVPKLIKKGDDDLVVKHCINDVKRLYRLTEVTLEYLSDGVINKHIEYL